MNLSYLILGISGIILLSLYLLLLYEQKKRIKKLENLTNEATRKLRQLDEDSSEIMERYSDIKNYNYDCKVSLFRYYKKDFAIDKIEKLIFCPVCHKDTIDIDD